MPRLLGWEVAALGGEAEKELEVALHAGAALALAVGLRRELLAYARGFDRECAWFLAPALLPPALAGLAFERVVEERLGGSRSLAAGLLAGSAALVAGDHRGAAGERRARGRAAPGAADGLWLGLAQAAALVPGVSRNGATLAAARVRGFDRSEASALSWEVGLPVLLGASVLKAQRLLERRADVLTLAAGALAAFAATLASLPLLRLVLRGDRPLWPWAAERCALAVLVLWHDRRS